MKSIKRTGVIQNGWKSSVIAAALTLVLASQAAAFTPGLDLVRLLTQDSNGRSSVLLEMSDPTGSSPASIPLGVSYDSAQAGQAGEPQKDGTNITIDFKDLTFTNLVIE